MGKLAGISGPSRLHAIFQIKDNCHIYNAIFFCWTSAIYPQGGLMADETVEQKLARLEAENKSLKEQMEDRKPGQLRLKISEKGGLSVYGLGRFPVTLYKEQWARLLEQGETIKKFLKEHDQELKAKQ